MTLRASAGALLRALPEGLGLRLAPRSLGYGLADIPPPLVLPPGEVRLLVAPANSAAQGYAWARSAERLPGVGAANLTVVRPGALRFPADAEVPSAVMTHSRRWSRAQASAVGAAATHVLIESEQAILGVDFDADPRREAAWLDAAGIAGAYVSHGSDLRLPSAHAERERWSPFRDAEMPLRDALEATARRNAVFLAEQGRPVFVSTPDLLTEHPSATWLPMVIAPEQWHTDEPVLRRRRPIVVHAPSNPQLKGTALIAGAVERLDAERIIDYRPAGSTPHSQMSALYARADVVLEQFRIGIYSTTAVEAMAAGRLVLAHISPDVRAVAERESGMPLPIVDADPDDIEAVLCDVAARPDHYRAIAARGPAYGATSRRSVRRAGACAFPRRSACLIVRSEDTRRPPVGSFRRSEAYIRPPVHMKGRLREQHVRRRNGTRSVVLGDRD